MNVTHFKNNTYKNGEYNPHISVQMAKEKAKSIEPTQKQAEYRDALYKFCVQKGIVGEWFTLRRTNRGISSNIQALKSTLRKNGLADEFFCIK